IVGDRDDASVLHRADSGQLFPSASLGDGADWKDISHGELFRSVDNVARHSGVVVHGHGVGHAADRSEATGCGCPGACFDSLVMLDAGPAQMYVDIDEAWSHYQSGSVVNFSIGEIEIDAQRRDASILNRQVLYQVEAGGRVDDTAIFN